MQIPHFGSHNKLVWATLIAGGIIIGLYLRHRNSAASSTDATLGDGSTASSDIPDIGDPYSTMGGGTVATDGTGASGNGSGGSTTRIIIRYPKSPPAKHPAKKPKPKKHSHTHPITRHKRVHGSGSGLGHPVREKPVVSHGVEVRDG